MSWNDIVGFEAPIRLLKGQLAQGRLSPTYLFVGLPGIGKRRLALELAKAVECLKGEGRGFARHFPGQAAGAAKNIGEGAAPSTGSGQACDQCEACQKIEKGTFPDVMTVASESESGPSTSSGAQLRTGQIGIDQVRALAGWMHLTPHSGRWKVGIVANADRLTEEAAHGSLKLLEEPPEQSLLLLTASAAYRLPSTLVSRCHLVRCLPQGIERVAGCLEREEHLEPALARLLAIWSGGRLGLALEFHRHERLAAKNGVLDQFLGALKQEVLEIPLGNAPRSEVEEALEWIAAWWRDLVVLSLNGDPKWLIHQDRLEELKLEVGSWKLEKSPISNLQPLTFLEEFLKRVDRTYWVQEAVQRNASPRIALAALLSV